MNTPGFDYDRNEGLGASDCAAVMGLSKWKTPLQLYMEKRGEIPPVEQTIPMKCGHALEPLILQLFSDETGLAVGNCQERIIDHERPWRWATIDAMTETRELVDAKSTGHGEGYGDDIDDVPMDVFMQMQHQLAVAELEVCWVPVLIPMGDFRIYRVDRDDDLIRTINQREEEFMERLTLGEPPEPVSADDSRLLWPRDTGRDVTASEEAAAMCEELKLLREQIKAMEADAEDLKANIQMEMKDASRLVGPDGKPLATFKAPKPARQFSTSKFKVAYPALYNQFTEEADSSRRFLLK